MRYVALAGVYSRTLWQVLVRYGRGTCTQKQAQGCVGGCERWCWRLLRLLSCVRRLGCQAWALDGGSPAVLLAFHPVLLALLPAP